MKKMITSVLIIAIVATMLLSVKFPVRTEAVVAPENSLSGSTGTFESSEVQAGWSAFQNSGSLVTSTDVAHSGSRSLKLNNRFQTWHSPTINIYNIQKK